MAAPGLDEVVTTTLRNRSGKLADQISRNNALLHRLRERRNRKPAAGGRTLVQELEYAQNSAGMWYSGYEALDISPTDIITAAEFDWKQASVPVTISGREQLMNDGREKVIDLLESRIKNAEKTMENLIGVGVYSDGSRAKEIGGLQFLVADDPTVGVVGGIDRAAWPFWRNLSFSAATDGGAAATKDNIKNYMNEMWVRLVRGTDRPDLILTDNSMYVKYLSSMQEIQRVTSSKMADAGFTSLKFMDADVVMDGGFNGYASDVNPAQGGCPANHMYFLNTDYILFRPHKDRDMVPMGGNRQSVNQDALVKLIGFMGNMTMSNARLQGVITA